MPARTRFASPAVIAVLLSAAVACRGAPPPALVPADFSNRTTGAERPGHVAYIGFYNMNVVGEHPVRILDVEIVNVPDEIRFVEVLGLDLYRLGHLIGGASKDYLSSKEKAALVPLDEVVLYPGENDDPRYQLLIGLVGDTPGVYKTGATRLTYEAGGHTFTGTFPTRYGLKVIPGYCPLGRGRCP